MTLSSTLSASAGANVDVDAIHPPVLPGLAPAQRCYSIGLVMALIVVSKALMKKIEIFMAFEASMFVSFNYYLICFVVALVVGQTDINEPSNWR